MNVSVMQSESRFICSPVSWHNYRNGVKDYLPLSSMTERKEIQSRNLEA